ncbi:MAG: serine/threonine-protein kinase [Polyangiaceae bacterium]|nr:serine/threonine-protein kinase [Polyangiaceae bacterium]
MRVFSGLTIFFDTMAGAMDLTGATCGRYEVWGPIGEGGMSRVWLARHKHLAVPVILKTLRESVQSQVPLDTPGAFATSGPVGRLLNEARMMARIPSAKVVKAVDVGVHEGLPYIVQEYVDGLDLAELDALRRRALRRGLPLWYVCQVTSDVADALHAAHLTGVLHRDVKPSNLLYSPQIGLRLGDFGIAVTRDFREGLTSGTLRFIAPEALRGADPTRRADIYSLGATAYDLLYGNPPFTELADIVGETVVKFPAARSAEEAYFQHVLAKMLRRDPHDRSHSAHASERLLGSLARALRPKLPAVAMGRGQWIIDRVKVSCVHGDIAEVEADGIVNSANDEMKMRSGVGDALRRRGGDEIEEEATKHGRRALGDCLATSPGALKCKALLHAVGAWREVSCLARTSQRALLLAEELGLRTLAIPALGTGLAKVAPEASAYAVASALRLHLLLGGSRIQEVRFVLYDQMTFDLFVEQVGGVFLGDEETGEEQQIASDLSVALDETVRFGPAD